MIRNTLEIQYDSHRRQYCTAIAGINQYQPSGIDDVAIGIPVQSIAWFLGQIGAKYILDIQEKVKAEFFKTPFFINPDIQLA